MWIRNNIIKFPQFNKNIKYKIMKIPILLQVEVEITNSNINDAIKEFPTLRTYLQGFKRTRSGMFISEAEVSRENDKEDTVLKDSIKLRNALLDWSFNEAGQYIGDDENGNPIYKDGDANKFFNKYPKGFKFKCYKICDL